MPVARFVYAKPPFAGPAQILAYLARYTHRVAIANSRLIELGDDHVSFRWKDYRENGRHKIKVMRLAAGEFIRRFLMHTLPTGFHRIRYYGFAANGHRSDKLAHCRRLLDVPPPAPKAEDIEAETVEPADHASARPCPCCGGRMLIVEQFARGHPIVRFDSS